MKTKDKAKELYNKYWDELYWDKDVRNVIEKNNCKKCALICVDEIIKTNPVEEINGLINEYDSTVNYWQEVKQEINQL